jgi:Phytanoyl-CoA dioxygenase (PhyH)
MNPKHEYKVVTEEQVFFYRANGYLKIEGVFEESVMDELASAAEEHSKGLLTNYLDMHHHPSFAKLHRGETLCNIGDDIMAAVGGRDRAIPIGSTWFFCPPKGLSHEHGSTWHQDNYASLAEVGAYLNIAVAVDDADETNGALLVVPGSHLLGDLPCNPKPNFGRDSEGRRITVAPIGNDCELPQGLPIKQLTYKKGDVLVVHGHLVHKAEKNLHPTRWRRTMYFVYIRENKPFWPGWTSKRQLLDRYDSPNRL